MIAMMKLHRTSNQLCPLLQIIETFQNGETGGDTKAAFVSHWVQVELGLDALVVGHFAADGTGDGETAEEEAHGLCEELDGVRGTG